MWRGYLLLDWQRTKGVCPQAILVNTSRYSHTFVNESSADNLVALSQVVTDGAYHCRMYELAKLLAAANVATYVVITDTSHALRGSCAGVCLLAFLMSC